MDVLWGRWKSRRAAASQVKNLPDEIDYSLGSLRLGSDNAISKQATVDCCFLSEDTLWGIKSSKGAGLVMLRLTLSQPTGYKLKCATLHLCFTPDVSEQQADGASVIEIAPRRVCGIATEARATRSLQVQPEIGIGEVAIGGIGVSESLESVTAHRWLFETRRLPCDGVYRIGALQWEANPDNDQNEQCGPLAVAIAISHCQKPFLIRLRIEGQLRKSRKLTGLVRPSFYSGEAVTRMTPRVSASDISPFITIQEMEKKIKTLNDSI